MTTFPKLDSTPSSGPGFGARWCDEHDRWECVGNRSRGRGICHGTPPRGGKHCRIHSGKKFEVARAEAQARVTAWNAMGGTPDVDYRMAVLGVLQMTWLRLGAYSELLRRQVAIEGGTPEEGDLETSGLIGHRFGAAGKEGHIYAQSEEVRALVALEAAERDRVVRFAKSAHEMGISERLTSLAEQWGDLVAGRITAMLADPRLNLSPVQQAVVPAILDAHLGSIDMRALETAEKAEEVVRRGVRNGGGPS